MCRQDVRGRIKAEDEIIEGGGKPYLVNEYNDSHSRNTFYKKMKKDKNSFLQYSSGRIYVRPSPDKYLPNPIIPYP